MAPLLLGVLEEFDGSLIGAFGCREIALDAVVLAGIGLAEEDAKDAAVALWERKLVEVRVFVSLGGEADTGFGLAVEEKHGFDALGAVVAPEGLRKLAGEQALFGADRLIGFGDGLPELVEIGFRLPGDEQRFGAQTVREPVLAGDGFADDGLGSGGVLGVFAVAFDDGRGRRVCLGAGGEHGRFSLG